MLARNNDNHGAGIFTTELGTWAPGVAGADSMLKLLTSCHGYATEYAAFYVEPKLRFLQGSAGNFIQKESYMKYSSNSATYQYPYAALGAFFLKNVKDRR
jgi:hypothetical protein